MRRALCRYRTARFPSGNSFRPFRINLQARNILSVLEINLSEQKVRRSIHSYTQHAHVKNSVCVAIFYVIRAARNLKASSTIYDEILVSQSWLNVFVSFSLFWAFQEELWAKENKREPEGSMKACWLLLRVFECLKVKRAETELIFRTWSEFAKMRKKGHDNATAKRL
jgi:hypothetical protein